MTIIPLAPPSLAGSSNRPGSIGRAVLLPYLVLLRAGFCLPRVLPPARCALTAPFHPYRSAHPFGVRRTRAGRAGLAGKAGGQNQNLLLPSSLSRPSCRSRLRRRAPKGRVERRYIFCATFLRVAPTGRYPAHCPAEFGLSSESPESDYVTVWLAAIPDIVLAIGLLRDLVLL